MPRWIASNASIRRDDPGFYSGAALAHCHQILARPSIPLALLRQRLALQAGETSAIRAGRPERQADLRDSLQYLSPGGHPGPGGAHYLTWRHAVERPLNPGTVHRALPDFPVDQISNWLARVSIPPVDQAAAIVDAVLDVAPRAENAACLVADACLARAFGWPVLVPLLGLGMTRALLSRSEARVDTCHQVLASVIPGVLNVAADLARRAGLLHAVAPKLRARGSDEAVALFLSRDVLAPSDLTMLRSPRAARRICDRLVTLGAIREMTGRETFRLYGV